MPNKVLRNRLDQLEKDVDAMVVLSSVCAKIDAAGASTASATRKQTNCECATSRDRTMSRHRDDPASVCQRVPGSRLAPANRRAGNTSVNNNKCNNNSNSSDTSGVSLKQRVTSRTKSEVSIDSRSPLVGNVARGKEETAKSHPPCLVSGNIGRKARGDVTPSRESTSCCCKDKSNSDEVSEVSLQTSSSSDEDETTVKLEEAIKQLQEAKAENFKLRDMLEDNRITVKELSQSKAVALNLAKQIKEKYDVLKSEHELVVKRHASARSVCFCCGEAATKELTLLKEDNERKRVLALLKDIAIDYSDEDDGATRGSKCGVKDDDHGARGSRSGFKNDDHAVARKPRSGVKDDDFVARCPRSAVKDDDHVARGPRSGVKDDDRVARGPRSGVKDDEHVARRPRSVVMDEDHAAIAMRHRLKELESCLALKDEVNERLRMALEDKMKDDGEHRRYLKERETCDELRREAEEKEELTSRQLDELSHSLRDHTLKIAELTEMNLEQENLLAVQQKSLVSKAKSEEILNRLTSSSTVNITPPSTDEGTVDSYKAELMNQKCRIKNLVDALSELDALCIDAQQKAHHFEMEVNSLKLRIKTAEKMFNDLRSEKDTHIEKLSTVLAERVKKMQEFHDVQRELSMAEKSLTRMAGEIANLKTALREMKSDEKNLQSLSDRCEREIADKEDEVMKLKRELREMESSHVVGDLSAGRERVKLKIKDREDEIRNLRVALGDMANASSVGVMTEAGGLAAKKVSDAEARHREAERRAGEIGRRLVETEKKLDEAERRVGEANGKLAAAERKVVEAEKKIKRMLERMKELEDEARTACDCVKEAATREDSLHESAQRLTSESKSEINSYKNMLQKNEHDKKELINRCQELEEEIMALERNIEEFQEYDKCRCADKESALKELKTIAVERESKLRIDLENLNQRCEELCNEVKELKTKMLEMNSLTNHQENLLSMQQQVITNKDEQIQMANKEVDAIRQKSVELETHLKQLRQSLEAFEASGGAEKLEAMKIEFEKSLQESRQLLESTRTECVTLKNVSEEKAVLVDMLKDDLKEKSEQMSEVLQELEREKKSSGKLAEELDHLIRKIEKREAELERTKRSIGQLEAKANEDSGLMQTEKDRLMIKDKIIEDQAETVKQLKDQVKPLEKQIAAAALKNVQLLTEIQDLKWLGDDLRAQLEELAEESRREKKESKDSNSEEYERQNTMLNDLETQVEIKQREWEEEFSRLVSEKESADNSARYATQKLVETVTTFQRQIAEHRKVQHSLTGVVRKQLSDLQAAEQQLARLKACQCLAKLGVVRTVSAGRAPDGSKEIKPMKILLATRDQRASGSLKLVERRQPSWGSGKYVIPSR